MNDDSNWDDMNVLVKRDITYKIQIQKYKI